MGFWHLALLAYLVHHWCLAAQRYCYVQLLDMELGRLFQYQTGDIWHPEESELLPYGKRTIVHASSLHEAYAILRDNKHQAIPLLHIIHPRPRSGSDWFTPDYFLQVNLSPLHPHPHFAPFRFLICILIPIPTLY